MNIQGTRVVIVDKDASFCENLSKLLQKLGVMDIDIAPNDEKGKMLTDTSKPPVFLLDRHNLKQAIELAILSDREGYTSPHPDLVNRQSNIETIFVKVGSVFKKIVLSEVDYVVYADRYANLIVGDKKIPLNLTMKELAQKLPSDKFIQIHQSYIVNIDKITQIIPLSGQIEVAGKELPIGTSFKKNFQDKLVFLT